MWYGGTTTIYDGGGTSVDWDNGKAPAFSADFGNTTGDSFSYESGPFVGTVEFTLYSDQDLEMLSLVLLTEISLLTAFFKELLKEWMEQYQELLLLGHHH